MKVLVDVRNPADFLLLRGEGSYIFICVLFGCLVVGVAHLPREEGLLDSLIVSGRGYDFVCA